MASKKVWSEDHAIKCMKQLNKKKQAQSTFITKCQI